LTTMRQALAGPVGAGRGGSGSGSCGALAGLFPKPPILGGNGRERNVGPRRAAGGVALF